MCEKCLSNPDFMEHIAQAKPILEALYPLLKEYIELDGVEEKQEAATLMARYRMIEAISNGSTWEAAVQKARDEVRHLALMQNPLVKILTDIGMDFDVVTLDLEEEEGS